MKPRRPISSDENDLSNAQLEESEWLRARDNDPTALTPSPEIARDYEEIEDMLASMPVGAPDPAWQKEILRKVSRRKVLSWTLSGTFVAAAATAAVVMLLPRAAAELEVTVRPNDTRGDPSRSPRRDPHEAAIGDHLVVTARPRGQGDLRVYGPGGKLVSRCPGPSCAGASEDSYSIDVSLEAPVRYYVILVIGRIDAPITATMDEYLNTARTANARIVSYTPIDVH